MSDFAKGIDIQHDQTLNNVIDGSFTLTQGTATSCTINLKFTANTSGDALETSAANSGNVVVDGSGSSSTSWITGTWYRNL